MLEPNLYHLKYFADAASLGSVGAAARKNSVSQPAVSQGIKKLELALGVELLVHSKNRFKLTPEGELVLVRIKEILSAFQNLREELSEKQEEVSGQVSLGTMRSLALHFLPKLFKNLKDDYDIDDVDFYIVMNSLVNDYGKVIDKEDTNTYAKMARSFILDEDAKKNKVWIYFTKIVK